jgi:hypothetical protein
MKKYLILLFTLTSLIAYSQDTTKTFLLDSIQVVGIKPQKKEPITITTIKIDSIRHNINGNDPFFVMRRRLLHLVYLECFCWESQKLRLGFFGYWQISSTYTSFLYKDFIYLRYYILYF